MDTNKTSQSFGKVSIKLLKYVIVVVVALVCATTAYNFGTKIFSEKGVQDAPGTDLTITVSEGMTIDDLGEDLEEYQIIEDSTVFKVLSYVYSVDSVKPGTYILNTSMSGEDIFKTIVAGPEEEKTDQPKQ